MMYGVSRVCFWIRALVKDPAGGMLVPKQAFFPDQSNLGLISDILFITFANWFSVDNKLA